jgi:arylsulfatase A-like enzyme
MHVTDWFTTLRSAAGISVPADRVIDGVDQLEWLTGHRDDSALQGFLFRMRPEPAGAPLDHVP